ncbi:Uncharacterised protein [Burkholderia pseudomallei]|nr:Uncharacterised protein [Burkholderia pseudomallei]CAJ7297271.1 Uncharacterised protein [Burkholderia pseudomallei]
MGYQDARSNRFGDDLYVVPLEWEIPNKMCWLVAEGTIDHSIGIFTKLDEVLAYLEEALQVRKKERTTVCIHYMFERCKDVKDDSNTLSQAGI